MKIEVIVQAHNFERRLCWMLSSILQQQDMDNVVSVQVTICCMEHSEVSKTADLFKAKGLNVKKLEWAHLTEFQYRGMTRNKAVKESDADFVIFADADMVYPPLFFRYIQHLMITDEWKDCSNCMYSERGSTYLEQTNALVDYYTYPCVIPKAWDKASTLKYKLMVNKGAGYFQLVNLKQLRLKHGGCYQVNHLPGDSDWFNGKPWKAFSDVQFRCRLKGKPIPLPMQLHLQHFRNNVTTTNIAIVR